MRPWNARGWAAVVLLGGTLAAGCTAMRRDSAFQTERTLAAAGFQMKFADDPAKLASIAKIQPQRGLVPQQMDGEPRFVNADANFCKCIYVGTEKAYQRYQGLAIRQEISDSRLAAAQAQESAAMNWGMWGGWGPWY